MRRTQAQPIQQLIKGELPWTATEGPGTEVAQIEYQAMSWPQLRRLVWLRHRVNDQDERGGKKLLDVPGYRFQALGTSLPSVTHPPLAVWRYDNGRADCENVIKELQVGFALPTLCLEQFWASEAALSLATLTDNLIALFERHWGWQHKATLRNLRFWLFVTAGGLTIPPAKPPSNWLSRTGNATGATIMGENFIPVPQLQCSRKPPRPLHLNHMEN